MPRGAQRASATAAARLETPAPARCKDFFAAAEAASLPSDRVERRWHPPCPQQRAALSRPPTRLPMPILSGDRPLATITTVLDTVSVALWALLLCVVTRCSKVSLTRDLFGI